MKNDTNITKEHGFWSSASDSARQSGGTSGLTSLAKLSECQTKTSFFSVWFERPFLINNRKLTIKTLLIN